VDDRIADEIVALVERAGEPVSLLRVDRRVAGFAASERPYRHLDRELGGKLVVLHVRGWLSGAPRRAAREQGGR
jgi:hypothetical protein